MSERVCRACGAAGLEPVLDLGEQPLANRLLRREELALPEPRYPLAVCICPGCRLMQITKVLPPGELFSEYIYFTSYSDQMLAHAREAAHRYLREGHLDGTSFVVEIASNDGYLLRNFVQAGIPCLGIDPAANVAEAAREVGVETLGEFFGNRCANELRELRGGADLILGNNVFAHAPDINDFVSGLRVLLKPCGQIVLEVPYGLEMLRNTEFDTIYHEHVFYFTLSPLIPLFRQHGLDIFHIEYLAIHGGSLRIFAAHAGTREIEPSVGACLERESALGVKQAALYAEFQRRCARVISELSAFLRDQRARGRSIAGYGASAKGSTLLNALGLPGTFLEFIADRSPHKHGKFSPGLHIPIVTAEELRRRGPDCAILLTWNFAEEIVRQQGEYLRRGGAVCGAPPESPCNQPKLMNFTPTVLSEVILVHSELRKDKRGFLARIYCEEEFAAQGLNTRWVQHNITQTHGAGSVRGLHWQAEPQGEIKLVRCLRGEILDLAVDVRPGSPTFGKFATARLGEDKPGALYIPAGFAHGFQCLTETCELLYLMSQPYQPALARGISARDPDLGIPWPFPVVNLSTKDSALPRLTDLP